MHKGLASRLLWLGLLLFFAPLPSLVSANSAAHGGESFLTGEYKLPATLDALVSAEVETELWAVVYRPRRSGRFPLLVFLHGNHSTCGYFDAARGIRVDDRTDYTETGVCPEGWVPVPNHLGYAYLAEKLASEGYVVVSINANRGVNAASGISDDRGLNLRRGRLVLRHLQQLGSWNAGKSKTPSSLGFDLRGLLDFRHVGLLGHSRGGEGMRAAHTLYRDADSPWPARIGKMTVEALYEIAPVDGQTSRVLDADDLAWNVLLPACDGDVSSLSGVRPFDRMISRLAEQETRPKSSFQVYGANHNFYNTEWQLSDAEACPGQVRLFPDYGGSAEQRKTAEDTVIPFFKAHVGARTRKSLAARFDPSVELPVSLREITYYARGYSADVRAEANFRIDDFNEATGLSSRGVANDGRNLDIYLHGGGGSSHDRSQRAATVQWSRYGAYLQVNATERAIDLSREGYRTLEFRVKLECFEALCTEPVAPTGQLDFSIRLVGRKDRLSSPVMLSEVARVFRPVSAYSGTGFHNSVFQTVRIPLEALRGVELREFRGVRFTFDRTPGARVSFGQVRLVRASAGLANGALMTSDARSGQGQKSQAQGAMWDREANRIVAVRRIGNAAALARGAGLATSAVEIELASTRAFPVTDALPVLHVGDARFETSRFESASRDRMVFTLSAEEYAALPLNAAVQVSIGGAAEWEFGTLGKP